MSLLLYMAATLLPVITLYALMVKRHFDVCSFYVLGQILLFIPGAALLSFGAQGGDSNPFLAFIRLEETLMMQGLVFAVHAVGVLAGYVFLAYVFSSGDDGSNSRARLILPYFSDKRSNIMSLAGLIILSLINMVIIAGPLMEGGGFLGAIFLVRNEFYFSGSNYLRIFLIVGTFLAGANFAHMLRYRKVGHYGLISLTLAGSLFVLNLLLSTVLGGKGFIIYPLIFFLLALYARQLYRRIGVMVMLFMVFISAVVALQQIRVELVHDNQSLSSWDYIYVGLRLRLFEDNLVYLGSDDELHSTKTGEDFINGVLGPVPRSLWTEKPEEITAGARFKRQLMPRSTGGWPPYGMNQWYVNFGWLGALIGGVLTGAFLRALQRVYYDYQTNTYSFFIMMIFLVRLLIDGGVGNMFFVEYVFYILPLFLFGALSDRRLYETIHIKGLRIFT